MIKIFMTSLMTVLMLLGNGCSGSGAEEEDAGADSTSYAVRRVELPGTLLSPTGDTVTVGPDTAVVLYYWLPLDMYGEMERDLLFLASLDSTVIPLPIQPDHETRNHAQRVVNNLGISLTVYLADSSIMDMIDSTILPYTLLLFPGENPVAGTGFGSPARLLAPYIREE
ncbi:MAG: hypothetical protein JXA64_02005 [Candidatus Fermentibacteraceae bacterium]|nr:hypothetical protein [Candidatus Fermentibacteraceae bacterium]MBN2607860.1 hypothetical protein [Candidatus Fermentibacteraceae bacterium]